MRQMKDSGIEWIGEIPESWSFIKGKFLFTERNERGNKNTLQLLSPTQKYGVIPQSLYEELSGMKAVKLDEKTDYNTMKSIYNGDFCISLRSFQGGFEYSEYDGVVSPAYHVFFKTKDLCNAYYRYLFKEQGFIAKMASLTKTFRDGKSIAFTDFSDSLIPVPPLSEQKSISAYLDRQCALIDSVIEKTKASIEEYKKLRQAVITQAVTKGVRGDRPMKDSGVTFIGNIPDNWKIERLKFILSEIVDCPHETPNYTSDGEYLVIRTADEDYGFLRSTENMYRLDKAEYENRTRRLLLEKDDIVYGREGERWGLACLVPESNRYCLGQRMMQFRCKKDIVYPLFLKWALNSINVYLQGRFDTIGSTSPHVNISTIINFKIPIPELEEQVEIANYAEQKSNEINDLIAKKEQFLTELESYKKSMIYEYVTGKKEVPTA